MFKLIQTCTACPEQYDVYTEDTEEEVGYMRLRWGHYALYTNVAGEKVYSSSVKGFGTFQDSSKRKEHLTRSLNVLASRLRLRGPIFYSIEGLPDEEA